MAKIKFITVAIIVLTFGLSATITAPGTDVDLGNLPIISEDDPPCLQMYYYIEKYSQEYSIPRKYAYGVAYIETRYEGPFDWNYNHAQTSYAGALGPMQIIPATAKLINGRSIPNQTLKTDIELNVKTSMKLLRRLKNKYGDWKVVFGCYNTGRPIVNDYAHKVYNFDPVWAPTAQR